MDDNAPDVELKVPEQSVHVQPPHINGSIRSLARASKLSAVGVFLLGVCALITAVVAWRAVDVSHDAVAANRELRQENACRFEVSAEVNAINEQINALTADIFVAAIEHPAQNGQPSAEVQALGRELDAVLRELPLAAERRNEAVETCLR